MKQKAEATRIKDVSTLTDEELMNLYCQGDNVAYAELFKRYTPRLVGFLTRFVGPTQAGDVAQISFIKIHQNRHRYRLGSSVPAWFFTIARNSALDYLRSAPKKREVFGLEIDHAAPEAKIDLFQDERIRKAIDRLPDRQKEVVYLHWFNGLSFEEVGQTVGATSSAVRVRAHRAYKKLRHLLGDIDLERA